MIAIAIVASVTIFQLSGYSAAEAVSGFVSGSLTGPGALLSTVRWAIPLAIVSLSVLLSFRAGFFNVGAQGQLYMGAIAAVTVSIHVPGPPQLGIAVGLVAAAAAGAAWSLIAAWLKTTTGADEVLTTLMLNFIGTLFLQYLTNGPLRDPRGSGQAGATAPIPADLRISGSIGVSPVNVTLLVLLLIGCWILVNRTTFGLSSTIVGRNSQVARRQGVSTGRVIWTSFALSGGLAGIAGAFEVLGPTGRLIQGFSPDLGFTAILVALVAGLTVVGVVFSALFFGALAAAVQFLPIVTNLPPSALDVLQGTVALLITVQLRARARRRRAPARGDDPSDGDAPTAIAPAAEAR